MPNWCANRIKITVPRCLQAHVVEWAAGTAFPYYNRAINQSVRMFIAGVAGRLKPATLTHYEPYPALTAHGCGEPSAAADAFSEWLELLRQNAWLDEACCRVIDRCYRESGLVGMKWDELTISEKELVDRVVRCKTLDWGNPGGAAGMGLFDSLELEPDGEAFDLRLIIPTRLACEINGYNGRLLEGVQSTYDLYSENYGTKWPSDSRADITGGYGWLEIDTDTAWSPPNESVMQTISDRWGCMIEHYFSEAGCDYCGYRRYEEGLLVECADDSLEYDEEDEHGWSDVTGPDWLLGNVPHYGG